MRLSDIDLKWQAMVTDLWDTTPKGKMFPSLPKGWRRVDENDFAHSPFFSYAPVYDMYRNDVQDKSPEAQERYDSPNGHWFHGHYLHYHDGTGTHIASVYDHHTGKYRIEFFRFGCDHKMKHTKNLGNCFNRYTCELCGYVNDVDSSD